jgi:hypothetical protein
MGFIMQFRGNGRCAFGAAAALVGLRAASKLRGRAMRLGQWTSAALVALIGACTMANADTVTWRFDLTFTGANGSGYFEVDPTNFIIPTSRQPRHPNFPPR